MKDLELTLVEIISSVGMAKSLIIEALREARNGKFDLVDQKLKEADEYFTQGHHAHTELIQREAGGEKIEFSLLIMHSEDQLMSAETIRSLALEMLEMYKELK